MASALYVLVNTVATEDYGNPLHQSALFVHNLSVTVGLVSHTESFALIRLVRCCFAVASHGVPLLTKAHWDTS